MIFEVEMGYLITVVAAFAVYKFISKYVRDHELVRHYQDEMYRHAEALVNDEGVSDELAEFAVKMHYLATSRWGTIQFIGIWLYCSFFMSRQKSEDRPVGLSGELQMAPKALRETLAKMTFSMAMVLERKSLLFGWLVFPMILSRRASRSSHPKTFNDAIGPQMIMQRYHPRASIDC